MAVHAVRSGALRTAIRRARYDRMGLLRDLADPSLAPTRVRNVLAHPATRELANVGLLFMPARYVLPIGWAATWLSRRLRRPGRRVR